MGAAVALVPSVLGSIWVSATYPASSDLRLIPQVWPIAAVLIAVVIWDAALSLIGDLRAARPLL